MWVAQRLSPRPTEQLTSIPSFFPNPDPDVSLPQRNTLPSTSDSSSTQESSHTKSSLQPSLEKDLSSESAISDDQNEDDDGAVRATQHIHGVGIGGGAGGGGGGGGGGGSDVRFGRKTSVNAKSQDITIADGEDTQGVSARLLSLFLSCLSPNIGCFGGRGGG